MIERTRRLWHACSNSELAELQRQDPGIVPAAELRLQYEEQPSFDMIRERSVDKKPVEPVATSCHP